MYNGAEIIEQVRHLSWHDRQPLLAESEELLDQDRMANTDKVIILDRYFREYGRFITL